MIGQKDLLQINCCAAKAVKSIDNAITYAGGSNALEAVLNSARSELSMIQAIVDHAFTEEK